MKLLYSTRPHDALSVKEIFTKSTLRILQTDFTSLGQNEGASDILVRGKYLVGIPSPQTKAKIFIAYSAQINIRI